MLIHHTITQKEKESKENKSYYPRSISSKVQQKRIIKEDGSRAPHTSCFRFEAELHLFLILFAFFLFLFLFLFYFTVVAGEFGT
ncbi:hypothetical protein BDV38DRAFT_259535, partial [Aspergillus pseudotamarii]